MLLTLSVPVRAGGPTFHLAAALEALKRIQDPELRALLRIDEIAELGTPWQEVDHYSTLRFVRAGNRLFLVGRGFDGIQTWVFESNQAWRKVTFSTPAYSDIQGWNQTQYFDTIRVEAIGDDIYLLARGANAVGLSKLDTTTMTWTSFPALNALSTFNQPQHYSTIRTEVVGDDLYLFARGAASVVVYVFETVAGTWRQLPSIVSMTDASGWNTAQHYSTIRTEAVGGSIYMLARGANGVVTLIFNTVTESWTTLPTYPVMTNAAGYGAGPWYYSTLRTEVVGNDIYLLGRGANSLGIYRLNTLTGTWATLPSTGGLTNASGWDQEQHYATIRTEVVGDTIYLIARASTGVITLRFSTFTNSWLPLIPTYPIMTNAGGWGAAHSYYSTLRTEVLGTDLYLLGRGANGVANYKLDTLSGVWQAVGAANPPWANGAGFDAAGKYIVDTVISPTTGPSPSLIYMAFQNGALVPDMFNYCSIPVIGFTCDFDQDPHLAEFLWEYSQYVSAHRNDPLVVANFLGCIAHVVGDYRLDRHFLSQAEATCGVNAQYASFPWGGLPVPDVQFFVDIWLDNQFAPSVRPLSGYPHANVQFPTPQVWAPAYLQGLVAAAFPPAGGLYSNAATTSNIASALDVGWDYTLAQAPNHVAANFYSQASCSWALSNFHTGLGGVRDSGEVIAEYFDRSWSILELGLAPRYELGNQGNQRSFWASGAGRLGDWPLTDFSVGIDLGDPQFDAYTTAAPDPDFEIALQTDTVSWHRIQSDVLQYEMNRNLVATLVSTPDGPRLKASKGFLDTAWSEWLPMQLFGFQVARFLIEPTAPGGDALRVGIVLADGRLYAFDRSLAQTSASSPVPTWIADGTSGAQLDGDRIGWLSGGDLWVRDGLTAPSSMVLTGVDAFQLEGRRIGAIVGQDLKIQEGPGQPWVTQLSNVAEFKLTESLAAALTTGGLLKARWGWRATESEGATGLTNAAGWNLPQYYSTLRTEVVGNDVYLFARGANTVHAYKLDTASGAWNSLPSTVSLTDAGGWGAAQYYSTIRTEVVGNVVYLLARGSGGIVTLRFDTGTEAWLPALATQPIFTDAGGYGAGPWYYSTLRTEVIGSDLYLLGRAANAVIIYRLDTLTGTWQALPSIANLTNAAGWDQEQYYSTIRTEVVGDVLYLLARASTGVIALRFNTVTNTWLPTVPTYPVMTNALGWSSEPYFASLRTEVVGTNVILLGRSSTGVVTYVLDTLTGTWSALPTYGVLTDGGRWNQAPYYTGLRTEVIGSDLYLLARANGGVAVHKLESGVGAWQCVSLGWPYWTDASGWDQPAHYETVRTEVIGSTLHLLARAGNGVISYALETGSTPWRTIARNATQFDLAGNFLAVDAPAPQTFQGVRERTPVLLGSVAPTPQRSLYVVPLGAIPFTLGSAAKWTWSSLLTQDQIARFRFGGDTKNLTAKGSWWLTAGLEDGTLIDYGRRGQLTRSWKQHLPVPKEHMPYDDSRIEVTVPGEGAPAWTLADRQALLIGGDLYVKDIK